jgi:anti-sigma factor RsiW
MNNDLLNILPDNNNGIDDRKLMDYLEGKLSGEEKYEVEKWMADNDIASDAVEGLENIKEKKSLQQYVDQLNKNLQSQLQKKKEHRIKRRLKQYPWLYFTIILILTLCIIAYIIITRLLYFI